MRHGAREFVCVCVCAKLLYYLLHIVTHGSLSLDSPCSFYFHLHICSQHMLEHGTLDSFRRRNKMHWNQVAHTHKMTRTVANRVALFISVKFVSWICLRGAHFPFVPFVTFFRLIHLFSRKSHLLSFIRRPFFFSRSALFFRTFSYAYMHLPIGRHSD